MNEERYLRDTFGRRAPFAVPDGYFDDLAQRLTAGLPPLTEPAPQPVTTARRGRAVMRVLRPLAAAACLCGIIGGAALYLAKSTATEALAIDMSQCYTSDYSTEQLADYAMLSKEDFYLYMTEE